MYVTLYTDDDGSNKRYLLHLYHAYLKVMPKTAVTVTG